jgi:hypothetical protein
MARATSALLVVCGVLLFATWLAAPATSSPQTSARSITPAEASVPPELAVVNAEVTRLRDRLDRVAELAAPTRDPFHFASRRSTPRELMPAPPSMSEPSVTVEAVIAWPTLVAILTPTDASPLQAAVTDEDETLYVVSVGDRIGRMTVTGITSAAVTVTDDATGRTQRLSVN